MFKIDSRFLWHTTLSRQLDMGGGRGVSCPYRKVNSETFWDVLIATNSRLSSRSWTLPHAAVSEVAAYYRCLSAWTLAFWYQMVTADASFRTGNTSSGHWASISQKRHEVQRPFVPLRICFVLARLSSLQSDSLHRRLVRNHRTSTETSSGQLASRYDDAQ